MLLQYRFFLVMTTLIALSTALDNGAMEVQIFRDILRNCVPSLDIYTCAADRTAKSIENAFSSDVYLMDDIYMKCNEQSVIWTRPKTLIGLPRLSKAFDRFLKTHTLTVDFGESKNRKSYDDEVIHMEGRKIKKKQKKYLKYTLAVLIGIFGLSTPIILNTLAIVAAKALIASKIALVMLGSVALKKIFAKDGSEGKVHTHTISLDDHDRVFEVTPSSYMPYSYSDYGSTVYKNSIQEQE